MSRISIDVTDKVKILLGNSVKYASLENNEMSGKNNNTLIQNMCRSI